MGKKESGFLNYLGQFRIYSLLDLIFLLIAVNANKFEFAGVIFLHLGFLLYLEYQHKHTYRKKFPSWLWIVLSIVGLALYFEIAAVGFLIAGFLYTQKNKKNLGWLGPVFRGLQFYFLVSGIIGFTSPISYLAGILLFFRNFAGDLRDVKKDKKEGLRTLPHLLGFKQDYKQSHLILLFITTSIWWYIADLSFGWLLFTFIIQFLTYDLTPR